MTYRDVRDTFMAEVLKEQGYRGDPGVFSGLETIVGCLVIVSLFWLRWVQDNRKALIANAMLIVAGPVIAAVGTWLFQQGLLAPGLVGGHGIRHLPGLCTLSELDV